MSIAFAMASVRTETIDGRSWFLGRQRSVGSRLRPVKARLLLRQFLCQRLHISMIMRLSQILHLNFDAVGILILPFHLSCALFVKYCSQILSREDQSLRILYKRRVGVML